VIEAVQRLLREREPPAKPRKQPEPAGPGWRVVPWDDDGTWLHIPPPLEGDSDNDEKETPWE
jgi:hypothetical protein